MSRAESKAGPADVLREEGQACERLLDHANSKQSGRYPFAGNRSEINPFTQVVTQVVHHGGDRELSAAASGGLPPHNDTPDSEIFIERAAQLESTLARDSAASGLSHLSIRFGGQDLPLGRVHITDGERPEIRDYSGGEDPLRIEGVQVGPAAVVPGIAGNGPGILTSRDLDPAIIESTSLSELHGIVLPLDSIGIERGLHSWT